MLFFVISVIIILGDGMQSERKSDVFYLILLVLTLITMIIGITFTYFSFVAKEKKDNTKIQTGILSINYVDGESIGGSGLIPINEPNLDTDYAVYKKKFSVRSKGTLDQVLDIYINVTKNDFSSNALRFALYNNQNKKIATGIIPSSGSVLLISGDYLKSNSTNDYTVLIWLQENNMNQNYEANNMFVGGFDITARQVKYE